jgi:DNA topoisomerase VI subunit B
MDRTAADRMRRMRQRRAAERAASSPLLFERGDWQLLINPQTWPQRAGCEPKQIGRVVSKELVENGLDAGGPVTIFGNTEECIVTDGGPGIAPADVPRLFSVNRPLLSSKLKRLPTRGMLGHGLRVVMGAVTAYGGQITVTTRGHALELVVDRATGLTKVVADNPVSEGPGTAVRVAFPGQVFRSQDFMLGEMTID